MKIKKLLFIVLIFLMVFTLFGCEFIDTSNTSRDDEYIMVSRYWALNEKTGEVELVYYISTVNNKISLYQLEIDDLELVNQTYTINYQLRGNYSITSQEPLNVYMVKTLMWESISEIGYIYSDNKLPNDVLVESGTLPIISDSYQFGDTIKVIYQDNNIQNHYILSRVNNGIYIRYGDIRELFNT
jgi:hypothetical protein